MTEVPSPKPKGRIKSFFRLFFLCLLTVALGAALLWRWWDLRSLKAECSQQRAQLVSARLAAVDKQIASDLQMITGLISHLATPLAKENYPQLDATLTAMVKSDGVELIALSKQNTIFVSTDKKFEGKPASVLPFDLPDAAPSVALTNGLWTAKRSLVIDNQTVGRVIIQIRAKTVNLDMSSTQQE